MSPGPWPSDRTVSTPSPDSDKSQGVRCPYVPLSGRSVFPPPRGSPPRQCKAHSKRAVPEEDAPAPVCLILLADLHRYRGQGLEGIEDSVRARPQSGSRSSDGETGRDRGPLSIASVTVGSVSL